MKEALRVLKKEMIKETYKLAEAGDKVAKHIVKGLEANDPKVQQDLATLVVEEYMSLTA